MARIGDFVDGVGPVSPETPGSVVFDRFQNEPNTLAIAVVDPDGRPLGLIERNAFTLKMAAEFGRALYARRPVSGLMDPNPPYAEASASAETFFRTVDAAEMNMLLRGFIVVENGLYVGVGAGCRSFRRAPPCTEARPRRWVFWPETWRSRRRRPRPPAAPSPSSWR